MLTIFKINCVDLDFRLDVNDFDLELVGAMDSIVLVTICQKYNYVAVHF